MEIFDTSAKIKCLIQMALTGEISWLAIDPVKLTPTLEKARQIIKILLKEFETHQSICTLNTPKVVNELSEDITEIDEDQSITDEVIMVQGSNSEEDEKQLPEQIMKIQSDEVHNVDDDDGFTNVNNDYDKSENDISGINSEVAINEDDVSKSIQLVEAFKGQLYTFIGDDLEERLDHKERNESKDHKKIYSKETKDIAGRTSYECEICGKCFKSKQYLNSHIRTHTGENPFQCSTCKKCFSQSSNLTIHERIHKGEKPHQCKNCTKAFVSFSKLKRHERTHTGEKPYKCEICKKSFTQIANI